MRFDLPCYILDGGMGTELQRRGIHTTLPLWSAQALFSHPETVWEIHEEYIAAGANIITTNTFRTQRRTLKKAGLEHETERINRLAVHLVEEARQESDRPVFIAASLTTLEDCYRPDLVPDSHTLEKEHQEQARLLAETSIDFFLAETLNTVREAVAIAQAVSDTGKPLWISFVPNEKGELLSGESFSEAVQRLDSYHPVGYGINCISPLAADRALQKLRRATKLPLAVYPNGEGHAGGELGWEFEGKGSGKDSFVEYCKKWKREGVKIIGGCCGTSPDYTRAYACI